MLFRSYSRILGSSIGGVVGHAMPSGTLEPGDKRRSLKEALGYGLLSGASSVALNALGGDYDSKTGKVLWQFQCGAGVNAPPVSYTVSGKQYIAVASGGNNQLDFKRGNSVFVFTLP